MKKKLIAIAAALCLLVVAAAGVHGQLAKGTLAVSIDSASSESMMTAAETTVEDTTAAVSEEPVVEDTPTVVEEPVVEDTPTAASEEPVVEDTPAVVNEPAVEETPADAEETSSNEETTEPEATEPVEGEETVTPEVTEPVEGEETVPPEVTEPVEGEETVTPEVTEPAEGEETVTPEVTEPVEGEETVTPEVTEPVEGEETVTPEETEEPEITIIAPLAISVSATDANAGEAISATASISGGAAPYQVALSVELDGVVMAAETYELAEEGSVSISYNAVSAGAYTISAAVADAAANTAAASAQAVANEVAIDYKDDHKWQAKADEIELTGDWRMDVLLIAQSQLGYTENTTDVEVNGDQVNGYTMYGEWAGNAYADWCAAFLGWCFEQADTGMDLRLAAVSSWVDKMQAYGAYRDATYAPEAGDIIFIIPRDETEIGHIGIVEYVSGDVIGTIEANVGNMADRRTYQPGDAAIGGFASMAALMDAMNVEYEGGAEAYTVEDVEDFTAYLNTDEEVNVRFGPSTDTMRAATLSGVGTPVTVTAQVTVDDTLWYLITCEDAYGTQTGYMMAKFLDGSAPVAEEEAEAVMLTVEEDEVVEEEPAVDPYAAEIAEWQATNNVTEEMLIRAQNATSLESLVIEGDALIYVRTGKKVATYDAATGAIIEPSFGLVVAYVDTDTNTVHPVVDGSDN